MKNVLFFDEFKPFELNHPDPKDFKTVIDYDMSQMFPVIKVQDLNISDRNNHIFTEGGNEDENN